VELVTKREPLSLTALSVTDYLLQSQYFLSLVNLTKYSTPEPLTITMVHKAQNHSSPSYITQMTYSDSLGLRGSLGQANYGPKILHTLSAVLMYATSFTAWPKTEIVSGVRGSGYRHVVWRQTLMELSGSFSFS
jgi:hypothetical protein